MADPMAPTGFDPIKDEFAKIHGMFQNQPGGAGGAGLGYESTGGGSGSRGLMSAGLGAAGMFAFPPFGAAAAVLPSLFGWGQDKVTANPVSTTGVTGGKEGNPQVGSLFPEGIKGNSLDAYGRSITNFLGTQGENTFNVGSQMLGLGHDILGYGLETMQDPKNYYSSILSGDNSKWADIMNPEASKVSAFYDNALKQARMNTPRSGYMSELAGQVPFQKAAQTIQLMQNIRPQAAKELGNIGAVIAGLGLGEEQLGLGEQGIGMDMMFNAMRGLLARRGQNIEEDRMWTQMISELGKSIGDIIGAYISK